MGPRIQSGSKLDTAPNSGLHGLHGLQSDFETIIRIIDEMETILTQEGGSPKSSPLSSLLTQDLILSDTPEACSRVANMIASYLKDEILPISKSCVQQIQFLRTDKEDGDKALERLKLMIQNLDPSHSELSSYVLQTFAAGDEELRLHLVYGKAIEELKAKFTEELHKMSGTALKYEAGNDIELILNSIMEAHGGQTRQTSKGPGPASKTKYVGDANRLSVIVPPQIATIDLPNQRPNMTAVTKLCGGSCKSPVQSSLSGSGESHYRLHVTIPQNEIALPASVIEKYAREVLLRNSKVISQQEYTSLMAKQQRPEPKPPAPDAASPPRLSRESLTRNSAAAHPSVEEDATPTPPTPLLSEASGLRTPAERKRGISRSTPRSSAVGTRARVPPATRSRPLPRSSIQPRSGLASVPRTRNLSVARPERVQVPRPSLPTASRRSTVAPPSSRNPTGGQLQSSSRLTRPDEEKKNEQTPSDRKSRVLTVRQQGVRPSARLTVPQPRRSLPDR